MIPLLPVAPAWPGCLGQATVVPISEELQSAGSWAFRYEVNRNVLPEVSARCTGTSAVTATGLRPGRRPGWGGACAASNDNVPSLVWKPQRGTRLSLALAH